ncbi:cation diffusion facilitator family transporter [Companilactobacillus metriopterae]|uniref:cation diffusion facilitator family transporter n=1 Tax=Companilactobacillus metriopterae TaxID=1909267 RepID=UPI00100A5AA0|nr:cation diffusion facilitator family transporter [Companilactobacillus metriopterae]
MDETHKTSGSKFLVVTLLNVVITIAEFIGGLVSGSLGLLSDALHNLQDTVSIIIAYIADLISGKKNDAAKTFGYKRAEIIAAFVNASVLIVITVFMVVESINRLGSPQKIDGKLMMIVAIVGLVANFISMLILFSGTKNNLNIRATFLHMLSDTLSSVGVVIASVFVTLFNWTWVDPVITIVIAIWLLKEAFDVIKESTNILMESSPEIDLEEVQSALLEIPEIVGIHHVHIWMIDENYCILDAHINVQKNLNLSELDEIYSRVGDLLKEKFNISHVTLQAECDRGLDKPLIE